MKYATLLLFALIAFTSNGQILEFEESGVITINSEKASTIDFDATNKQIAELQEQVKILLETIEKLSGQKVDVNSICNDVAIQLMVQHNQGLEKSRTTVKKAKEEGYTTYDDIYKYSKELLKIK